MAYDYYGDAGADLRTKVPGWLYEIQCSLSRDGKPSFAQQWFDRALLGGIYLKLHQLVSTLSVGANYFRITPMSLEAGVALRIVDKEPNQRMRTVSVWTDSAADAATPTVRLSTGGSGGIRINAGTNNDLGQVPFDVELWLVSDVAINVFVLERA